MKVLVLGCGPAGLMAAHASAVADHDVIIASRKQKSPLFGCQYLHEPIPHITDTPPVKVDYRLRGTPEGYREKVYGKRSVPTVSPDEYGDGSPHFAWDLRAAYDNLWDAYGEYVVDMNFDHPGTIVETVKGLNPDVVLSTIPAPLLCKNESEHNFDSEDVWAVGDAPELGQQSPIPCPENTVLCDGTDEVSWYRTANVFGHKTAEWPGKMRKPPIEGVVGVQKPLRTNCDCLAFVAGVPLHRLGRFGMWKKGVLSHSAFYDTFHLLGTQVLGVSSQEALF